MLNTLRFAPHAVIALSVVFLAGCSGAATESSTRAGSAVPLVSRADSLSKLFALTNPQHQIPVLKGRVGHSWMRYVPSGTTLVYASDPPSQAVDVFEYSSGTLVGQASGFSDPIGECSDKSGNVYVADFDTGVTSEIRAGTTAITNTFTTGGAPIGCSVSKKGDLAVTLFSGDPGSGSGGGGVYTFHDGTPTDHPGPANDWPATYDKKGDLIVECLCTGSVYELKKGASSWIQLTLSGATITFPSSAELMGKVIGLGDQKPNGGTALGIYSSKLSGSVLQVVSKTIATDTCHYGQTNVMQWGNVSKKPNGLQYKGKVTSVVGGNTDCPPPTPIDSWTFPSGGLPSGSFVPSEYPYAYIDAVTIVSV